jgi:hypothetical protein
LIPEILVYYLMLWGSFSQEGLGEMKVAVCLGMAFALVGCVTAQEQQQLAAAVAQCHSEKTPVEWVQCLSEPEGRIVERERLVMAYENRRTRQPQRPQSAPRVSEGTEVEARQ